MQLKLVMAELDPTIHVLATDTGGADNRVDARVQPAHEVLQLPSIEDQLPAPMGMGGGSPTKG